VEAVWDAFGRFLEQARAGLGPMLLECFTHRLRGHYEGDPAAYREALTADEWQQKDPILRFQRRALAEGWIDEADAAAIEREAAAAVAAAERFASASPFPPPELAARMTYT
jgi:pyruvate dehydrogenase E1 component alpha subunit